MSMMGMGVGLNDEALGELNAAPGVTSPSEINAGDGQTIIINASTDLSDPGSDEVIKNFDDFNIIIETGDELESERVRLEDVAQIVMAQETISYSDVQNLLKSIDVNTAADEKDRIVIAGVAARLDERVPLDSYTETPSTSNLEETKKFIKKELTINRDAIHRLYNDFFLQKSDDFIKRGNLLCQAICAEIEAQEAWVLQSQTYLNNATASKNYLAYMVVEEGEPGKRHTSKKLYDIRHFPLRDYQFKDVIEMGIGLCPSLFSVLDSFLRSDAGQEFLKNSRRQAGDISMPCDYYRTFLEIVRGSYGDNSDYAPSFTYSEILSFFASGSLVERLKEMKIYLEKELIIVSGLAQACKDNKPYTYNGKEFSFEEANKRVMTLLRSVCQSFEYLTTVENVRSICVPIFAGLNAVLVQE